MINNMNYGSRHQAWLRNCSITDDVESKVVALMIQPLRKTHAASKFALQQ